jgi:GTP-binding protein
MDAMKQQELDRAALENGRLLFAGPCDFMRGIADLRQLEDAHLPEIAFAGRSNVGKSSLINALTGRKTLAHVSNTPGRTAQLNFFDLSGRMCLVDMPGYGYAKVSKTEKELWDGLIRNYLRGRPTLQCVFLLIDSRHGLKDNDREIMTMLDGTAVPYRVVLTKADKRGSGDEKMLAEIGLELKKFAAAYPHAHLTSAEKGHGIAELRAMAASYANPAGPAPEY